MKLKESVLIFCYFNSCNKKWNNEIQRDKKEEREKMGHIEGVTKRECER